MGESDYHKAMKEYLFEEIPKYNSIKKKEME